MPEQRRNNFLARLFSERGVNYICMFTYFIVFIKQNYTLARFQVKIKPPMKKKHVRFHSSMMSMSTKNTQRLLSPGRGGNSPPILEVISM